MNIEKTASGVVLFPGVRDRFPDRLNEAHLMVLEGIQAGYIKQLKEGFFPPELGIEEMANEIDQSPWLAANNTLVRWRGKRKNRKLRSISYKRASFSSIFEGISEGLEVTAKEGWRMGNDLIAEEAEILQDGFRTGNTDKAMLGYLNMRRHPNFGIFAGFLDRYLNPWKFTLQGLDGIQDPVLSGELSSWSRDILRSLKRVGMNREPLSLDFIVCDSAGQSGYASERVWAGQTLPSQNYIASKVGYLIYLFDNVSKMRHEEEVNPIFTSAIPSSMQNRVGFSDAVDRSRRVVLAAHEIGHAAQVVPLETERRLADMYQTLREIYADGFSLFAPLHYPREEIITKEEVDVAVYYALARAQVRIRKHREKLASEDGDKSKISDPYPFSSAVQINWLLNKKALTINSRGLYRIPNLNNLRKMSNEYRQEIQTLTNEGSRDQVEDFIHHNSSSPVDFFTEAA